MEVNKKNDISSNLLRDNELELEKYKFLAENYERLLAKLYEQGQKNIESTEIRDLKNNLLSYFNYSLILDKSDPPFVYGNYTIHNYGDEPLHNPIICFKVNDPTNIVISGKIGNMRNEGQNTLRSFEEWDYFHEDWRTKWQQKGELWLKPKETNTILPGEKLYFSGFDLSFKGSEKFNTIVVEGYSYAEEMQSGVKAINSISISY